MGQAERVMSVVVVTGLDPQTVRTLTSYEIEALWKITNKKG